MRRVLRAPVTSAAALAILSFLLYRSTLLPGLDFGDTASFQVMASSPGITPRDAYPLYFAIGRLFVWLYPGGPAHALNVASAAEGAVACGLLVLVAFELSQSLVAALAAATAFAGSYTFWTQNVVAEVYALHMCLVLATLWLLLRWEREPTTAGLALFFFVYAAAFGNHLAMILFLPAYALFVAVSAPGGWRTVLAPRVLGLACLFAALGALQYAWNLHNLWRAARPPAGLLDALGAFWFDVTKSDWRDTMVLHVPPAMAAERLRMFAFEVRQQFGLVLPIAAIAGAVRLTARQPRRALLIGTAFAVNVAFALGYNVGDSHVFFLPSHLMLALLIAPGLALADGMLASRGAIAALAVALAAFRLYDTFPAVDRHEDRRPTEALERFTSGAADRDSILLTDLNWQVQNGLNYFAKYERQDIAVARMPDVLLYAPALLEENAAIGRRVLVSERARAELEAAYGPGVTVVRDPAIAVPTLASTVDDLPAGTRFVLCVLRPSREFTIDQNDLSRALRRLTGGALTTMPDGEYAVVAGVVNAAPMLAVAGGSPFRRAADVDGLEVDVRMESWLAFDTIRRMGFGQVAAGRRHTLIVERGISFAAFDAQGRPLRTAYLANIFAPEPRYIAGWRGPS
jgi:hypothetical protein